MDTEFVLTLLVMGLAAGVLARFLLPGRDPMSLGGTLLVGVVGSILGGVAGRELFHRNDRSFLLALLTTMVLLLVLRMVRRRRRGLFGRRRGLI